MSKPIYQGPIDALAARLAALETRCTTLERQLASSNTTAAVLSGSVASSVSYAGHGYFDIRAYGAKGDGVTDDTAAIQAALDAAGAVSGTVLVPAQGNPYLFTNLRMSPYTKLKGEHMWLSRLQRIPGSTGSAIREKTAAEGNPVGATGIWIQDLFVNGNNTLGDGIDLGRQTPAYALSTMAGMQNVASWYFPSGSGVRVVSNADSFSYLWCDHNATGVYFGGGGGNVLHSIYAEFNSVYQIQIADSGDTIFGIQIETDKSCSAHLRVDGLQNNFYGIYFGLGTAAGTLISNNAGANRNAYYGIMVAGNGNTWVDTVKHEAWNAGTGATASIHAYVIGEGSGDSEWYINGSSGATGFRVADNLWLPGGLKVPGNLTVNGTAKLPTVNTQTGDTSVINGTLTQSIHLNPGGGLQAFYKVTELAIGSASDGMALWLSNNADNYNGLIGLQNVNQSPSFLDPKIVFKVQNQSTLGVANAVERFSVTNGGVEVTGSIALTGSLRHSPSSGKLGFYGTTPAGIQTVTGSRGGNVGLTGLLNALAALGLIINNTTA